MTNYADNSTDTGANESFFEQEQELKRFSECYKLADVNDKRIIWAVLNKYVPFINQF